MDAVSVLAMCVLRYQGADVLNGVDRVDNGAHYTLANSVPCCCVCNSEKGDMQLRAWMDRKERPASETEAAYIARLLAAIN